MKRSIRFLVAVAALSAPACLPNQAGDLAAESWGDVSHPLPPHEPAASAQYQACGDGAITTAGAGRVLRSPYLQQMTDRSVSILWTERAPSAAAVRVTLPSGEIVGEPAATVDGKELSDGVRQLAAEADGLAANTIYCYELRSGSEALTAPAGFKTAPSRGESAPVAFAAFSDSGHEGPDQLQVFSQIESVPVDLLLHAGDVDQGSGTLAGYEQAFFAPYASLLALVPFFPAPGNHDYDSDGGETFRQVFSLPETGAPKGRERWYSFDWGPVHFIALDTQTMCDEQTAWLEQDLAATRQPWRIAYGHRPPYSSGGHGSNDDVRRAFSPIFERRGVALVISGHDHHYERTLPQNGVTYVVTGGGGVGTRPVGTSSFTAFSEQVLEFVHVMIEGDLLTLRAIDATGQLFDSVVIERPATSAQPM